MPGVKISQLPAVGSAQSTDFLPIVQGGVTYQETLLQIATLFGFFSGILSTINGGTGVASPTAHTLPVAEGSSAFTFLGPLANGQLLIGSTGADPVAAALSAGPGISIANGAGSITISGTASSIGWNVVTSSGNMTAENGYICNSAGSITLTLPTNAAVGTALAVVNMNTGGFTIAQNNSQNIRIGNHISTTGAGGSIASTAQGDSLYLICAVANTTWISLGGPQGTLRVT